jgi:hypothetical protein
MLVVAAYSAAIPLLNFAGLIVCFSLFWSDKYLFLREYHKPPNYSKKLIYKAINLIEFGLVIHLIFANGMLSNPSTLYYDGPYSFQIAPKSANSVATIFSYVFDDVDGERFKTTHASVYLAVSTGMICVYVVDKISGLSSTSGMGLISYPARWIVDLIATKEENLLGYSNNIFKEIDPAVLHKEYDATNDHKFHVQ